MTLEETMKELKSLGTDTIKNIFINHGAQEPLFGVKVGDLKTIVKKVKKDHQLALQLYATGNADAMYLAGLLADEKQVTKHELQTWLDGANWYSAAEYTVPQLAAEAGFGMELGLLWIDSENEMTATAGWASLSNHISITPNDTIDMPLIASLIKRVSTEIQKERNRVKYTMNGFVIAAGAYIPELTPLAKATGQSIGKVHVEMGKTACKVPEIVPYIEKIEGMARIGKKRKKARC